MALKYDPSGIFKLEAYNIGDVGLDGLLIRVATSLAIAAGFTTALLTTVSI